MILFSDLTGSRLAHLAAWPDSQPGLQALRDAGKFTTTLSNGSTRLLMDLVSGASPITSLNPLHLHVQDGERKFPT